MMAPPDELRGHEPYRRRRGTCPRCGRRDVTHLVIGMPAGPDVGAGDPDWVEWVGCMHPGHDRECGHCGNVWTAAS